jgi:hypothetical protein
MVEVKLGGAAATRIEGTYEPDFEATKFGAPFNCHIDHKGGGFAPRFNDNY